MPGPNSASLSFLAKSATRKLVVDQRHQFHGRVIAQNRLGGASLRVPRVLFPLLTDGCPDPGHDSVKFKLGVWIGTCSQSVRAARRNQLELSIGVDRQGIRAGELVALDGIITP
jgi:hypothetical protein